jgi:hypothetical protein
MQTASCTPAAAAAADTVKPVAAETRSPLTEAPVRNKFAAGRVLEGQSLLRQLELAGIRAFVKGDCSLLQRKLRAELAGASVMAAEELRLKAASLNELLQEADATLVWMDKFKAKQRVPRATTLEAAGIMLTQLRQRLPDLTAEAEKYRSQGDASIAIDIALIVCTLVVILTTFRTIRTRAC